MGGAMFGEFIRGLKGAEIDKEGNTELNELIVRVKAVLKELVRGTGLSVIPGTKALSSVEEARTAAKTIGYPVMLKACAGGGGRGIRLIPSENELEENYLQFHQNLMVLILLKKGQR